MLLYCVFLKKADGIFTVVPCTGRGFHEFVQATAAGCSSKRSHRQVHSHDLMYLLLYSKGQDEWKFIKVICHKL